MTNFKIDHISIIYVSIVSFKETRWEGVFLDFIATFYFKFKKLPISISPPMKKWDQFSNVTLICS